MFFAKSLRAKAVLWALIPMGFMLAVAVFVSLYAYDRVTRDVVEQRDTELARVSAARLAEGLRRHASILQDTAATPGVATMDPAQVGAALDTAQRSLAAFDARIVVYDADAIARWSEPSTSQGEGARFPVPADFERVRTTLRPVFSDVFRDPASGNDVVLIGVPVLGSGGAFKGVLAGMLTIRGYSLVGATLAQVLELKAGQTGFAYLVDGNGRVLYHQDASLVGKSLAAFPPVARTMKGESGALVGPDRLGQDVISGFAPVPGTNWGLITQEQWRNVVGPIRGYSWLVLGLLALGGALSGVVAFVAMGRILRPLGELTRGAQRVAAGDFDHQITPSTGDEVQVLADQFNVMTTALKQSYAGLEQRVAERTGELRESEERYRDLFEQSIDAIFMTSADGKVVDVNQAAVDLFGFTRHELIGRDYADRFVDPGDRERMRTAIAAGGGTVRDFELRLRKGDGTVMDCVLTVRRRGASEGTPAGLEGTVRDVTAAKRTEEELFAQTREMAVLDERNRMAREIHDTLAQGFTGIVLQLEAGEQALGGDREAAAAHIERAKSLARESLQEARRSVWDLVPEILEARSLEDALKEEVRRFAARGLEKAAFAHTGEAKDLPRDVQAALLRICQEALMNTRKHARASRVDVRLEVGPDAVSLVVQDDGVGFDPDGARADGQESGYGMTSMVQRARLQGGTLTIQSGGDKGTVIEAKIPTAASHQPA